jgi:hypothetical protein
MYLNLNTKEWNALQSLLERFVDQAHPDDVDHINSIRRRMRMIVGDALKDVDKGMQFDRWADNETNKLREIQELKADYDQNKEAHMSLRDDGVQTEDGCECKSSEMVDIVRRPVQKASKMISRR